MFIFVLIISLIIRMWYNLQPIVLFWDPAMYIGIGKYIYSGGTLGIFELFRPLLFPLILGGVWKIGIDPIIVGKIIAVATSLGIIILAYRLGESIKKNAGLYTSILVGFSPVFLAFSNQPLTDISSTFLALLAFYYAHRRMYTGAGIIGGLAFLTRFPQALIIPVLLLSLLLSRLFTSDVSWKSVWKRGSCIVLGFALITLPYFIATTIMYGNPLLPITVGTKVVDESLHHTPQTYVFYIKAIIAQNIFLIFAFVPLILLFFKKFKKEHPQTFSMLASATVAILIIGGYFSHALHQELRYGISFLPYVALLAGFGLTWLLEKIAFPLQNVLVGSLIMLVLSTFSYQIYQEKKDIYLLTPAQQEYFGYFKDKGVVTIFSSSPQFVAFSDVIVPTVMDTWEHTAKVYPQVKNSVEYVALNECEIVCKTDSASCALARTTFFEAIKNEEVVYSALSRSCDIKIYKMKKEISR